MLIYYCMNVIVYNIILLLETLVGWLNNHNGATYCCKKCLHGYSTPKLLEAYAKDCCHAQRSSPRIPDVGLQKQLPARFVVCADFESILKPVNEDVDVTHGVDTGIETSSHVVQEHIPCSFSYKIVSSRSRFFTTACHL